MSFFVRSAFVALVAALWGCSAALGAPVAQNSKAKIEFGYPRVLGLTDGNPPFLTALFKAIYETEGFEVAYQELSFSRAIQSLSLGGVDAVPMCLRYETPKVIWPRFPMWVGFGQLAFLKSRFPKGMQTGVLNGKRIVSLTGSALDAFFPKSVPTEVRTREQGLKMVLAGRADAFLDGVDGLQLSLRELASKDRVLLDTFDFGEGPLYIRFQDTPKGRELVKIYNARFPRIVESGEYLKLLLKYEPFAGFSKRVTDAVLKYNASAKQTAE